MSGLTNQEITRLINRYIGVSDGYLGNFSYRSHAEFYPEFCDLDIDPNQLEGTTRARFHQILSSASPAVQAKIVRGILKRFPPEPGSVLRTQGMHDEFVSVAKRLEGQGGVETPTLATTSAVVERALVDAETLIEKSGATSGVDRIHTALHGYLRAVCDEQGISYTQEATINSLCNLIRSIHPAFKATGPRADDIARILRSMSSVMDVLNPIRNNASVAHPNKELLEAPEAMLVINITRSILHYINARLAESRAV